MKKLLSILATIGLVATTSASVVACGKKADDEVQEIDRSKVIKEFIEEVNKIISEHIDLINPLLTVLETKESEFSFLNIEKLKAKGPEANKNAGMVAVDSTEKTDLIKDFNKLMQISTLETKINNLVNAADSKYSLILSNLPNGKVFQEVNFKFKDNNKIELNTSGDKKDFYANVTFLYEFQIYYEKSSGEIVKLSNQDKTFKFLLTGHKEFYDSIEKMQKNIKKDILDYSGVTFEDLNIKNGKTKLEDFTNEIQDLYNAKDSKFRTSLPDKIEKEYFVDENLDHINLDFAEQNIVSEIDWTHKYRSNTSEYNKYEPTASVPAEVANIHLATSNEENNPNFQEEKRKSITRQILKFIYRKDLSDEKNSIERILEILEQSLNPESKPEYFNLEEDFVKKINDELSEDQLKAIGGISTIGRITQLGTMVVKNLQAKVGNGENAKIYDIPGSFKMYVSYLPIRDGDEYGDRNSKNFKTEIAKNIYTGILGFREVYEIIKDPYDERTTTMGIMKKDGELLKLWGKWDEKSNLSSINEEVNLETDSLQETRRKLLSKTKQKNFKYSIVGLAGNSEKFYNLKTFDDTISLFAPRDLDNRDSKYNFLFEMDYFKLQITIDTKQNINIQGDNRNFTLMRMFS